MSCPFMRAGVERKTARGSRRGSATHFAKTKYNAWKMSGHILICPYNGEIDDVPPGGCRGICEGDATCRHSEQRAPRTSSGAICALGRRCRRSLPRCSGRLGSSPSRPRRSSSSTCSCMASASPPTWSARRCSASFPALISSASSRRAPMRSSRPNSVSPCDPREPRVLSAPWWRTTWSRRAPLRSRRGTPRRCSAASVPRRGVCASSTRSASSGWARPTPQPTPSASSCSCVSTSVSDSTSPSFVC
ncbi:Uncharacterised protein [Collinsella intestinalis]|nr:Uncharacterised protein [Collinsella intestinalis]